MQHIGFDRKFSLLAQEAHLTKNSLLSGFDNLLKANYFQDKEGYFYTSFFNLSIGIERILKLAVVTDYMLTNNYQTPTIKQLKRKFGHNIRNLYIECLHLLPRYLNPTESNPTRTANDETLIDFITEYSIDSRYFNLNEVCEAKQNRSPLYKWQDIATDIYEENTPSKVRLKSAMSLINRLDREGPTNSFTGNLDERGHPIMVFDILHDQYILKKSAPLVIWRLIEILQPINSLLTAMAYRATEYEVQHNIESSVIPHYEDFFYFLLSQKEEIKRRKRWL
jgi:hypothetical protein